jgi:hypothetical protein
MFKLILQIAKKILSHFDKYETCKLALKAIELVILHWNDEK